jgi:hypothetical protein
MKWFEIIRSAVSFERFSGPPSHSYANPVFFPQLYLRLNIIDEESSPKGYIRTGIFYRPNGVRTLSAHRREQAAPRQFPHRLLE